MNKLKHDQSGFSAVELILIILVVGLLGAVGFLVYKNQKKPAAVSTATVAKTTQTETKPQTQSTDKYLSVAQLGIRFKLSSKIQDDYYELGGKDENGVPYVRLSTHSLDAYSQCNATSDGGIATIATFKEGGSSPIEGDYMTAYPKAPKVGDYYYYIGGNQYDCTLDKNHQAYTDARQAFIDAYSTIEKIPN